MLEIEGRKICENCFSETAESVCSVCGYDSDSSVEDPTLLAPGSVLLGKYVIGTVIGKGGFGVTYLAFDTVSEKKVAIKEYFPYVAARRVVGSPIVTVSSEDSKETFEAGAEKFYEEAKLVSRFNGNPNIVEVYEYFYENDTVYLAMEYLHGQTLKEYIRDSGILTAPQALYIAKSMGNALAAAHKASVLHRDITPDNIILCNDGSVKLIDFGAARQVIAEYSQNFSVILKPGFAPLEQYHKKGNQGPWTDIYALGTTLYFGLTGDIPEDPMARFEDDDTFKENLFGIDPELWGIIQKAASLKKDDRYKDIEELLNDLNNIRLEPQPVNLMEYTIGSTSKLHGTASYNYKQHISFSPLNKPRAFFSDSDKTKVLYSTLDDNLKELYELIYNCVANSDEALELTHQTYNKDTVDVVYQRVLFDNPQFYYAGDCKIDFCDGSSVYVAVIKPVYAQADRKAMEAEVSEVVRVSRKDNNIDTLCAIHNYIIANTKTLKRNSDLLGSSAYGVTINKLADDIGFAKAFCYYVQEAGLPCYVVEGEFMGKPRAWCRFKLEDDIWYNADVYGDKFSGSAVTKLKITNDGNYFQTYFLTNDKYMTDHGYTISPEYEHLLEGEYAAASPKSNYYFQRERRYYFSSSTDYAYEVILNRIARSYSDKGQNGMVTHIAPFLIDSLYDKMNKQFRSDLTEILSISMEDSEFTMRYSPNAVIIFLNKNWRE